MKRMLLLVLPFTAFAMESGSWKTRKDKTDNNEFSAKKLIEIAKEQFASIPKNPEGLSREQLNKHYKEMTSLFTMLIEFSNPDSPVTKKAARYLNTTNQE